MDKLLPSIPQLTLGDLSNSDLGILYRVRAQIAPSLNREGLFHIPFELRHRVGTQRYSIPGLPSLYLGGSLYTCWAEMGKPALHELQASAFWLTEGSKVKLLDFSRKPERLLPYVQPTGTTVHPQACNDFIIPHLVSWPLLAMCSIVVQHRDSPFKPEYIFPQLVLQWITKEHQFDGVCYFSTHVVGVTDHPLPPCNIVLPAQVIKARGRCSRLLQLFKTTEPYSWQLLRAVNGDEKTPEWTKPKFDFEFIAGHKEPYASTEFGVVQTQLNKIVHEIRLKNLGGEPDLGNVSE